MGIEAIWGSTGGLLILQSRVAQPRFMLRLQKAEARPAAANARLPKETYAVCVAGILFATDAHSEF